MAYASTKSASGAQTIFAQFAFANSQTTTTPTNATIIQSLGSAGSATMTIPSTLVYHCRDAVTASQLGSATSPAVGVEFKWDFNVDQQNQNINGDTTIEVASNTSRVNPFIRVPVTLLPTQQVYIYAYPKATVSSTAPGGAQEELQIVMDVEPYSSFRARMTGKKASPTA
jgi:hypothetical protein